MYAAAGACVHALDAKVCLYLVLLLLLLLLFDSLVVERRRCSRVRRVLWASRMGGSAGSSVIRAGQSSSHRRCSSLHGARAPRLRHGCCSPARRTCMCWTLEQRVRARRCTAR